MKVEIMPYERVSLERLEHQFTVEREIVIAFAISLQAFSKLFQTLVQDGETEFRAGRVVLVGLVNHAHQLLIGGLHALEIGNGAVWSACVRGLMEVVGAGVLISEQPLSAPNHLEHVKAGKLRAAAERGQPGLGKDIDRLSQAVHPASRAILAGFHPADEEELTANLRFGLRLPTAEEGREGVIVLARLAKIIVEQFESLAANPKVVTSGRIVMHRTA
jgi:hypothetical protein